MLSVYLAVLFSWMRHSTDAWWEFHYTCHKCPFGLKDELIRILWSGAQGRCNLTNTLLNTQQLVTCQILSFWPQNAISYLFMLTCQKKENKKCILGLTTHNHKHIHKEKSHHSGTVMTTSYLLGICHWWYYTEVMVKILHLYQLNHNLSQLS